MYDYFRSVQLLRFIAATFVILSHFGIGAHSYKGIDILFVISGFVIFLTASAHFGEGWKVATVFLKRRLVRVFTFYWVLLYFLCGLGLYKVHYDWNFLKSVFLLPGHKSFLEITWSLSYELYFYAIMTVLVAYASFKQAMWLLILAWTISFVFLLLQFTPYTIQGSALNFWVGQNIWQILCGTLTAMFYVKIKSNSNLKWAWISLLLGLALFFANSNYYSTMSFLTAGIGSSLILFSVIALEKTYQYQWNIPLIAVRLGNASYVAYLIHIPIIHLFSHYPTLKQTNQFLILIGIWGLSLLLHELVERRLTGWVNGKVD